MLYYVIRGISNTKTIYFRTRLKSDFSRMILAFSITLTPGTICVDLNDDHLVVNWFLSSTTHNKEAGIIVKGKLEYIIGKVLL